MPRAADPAVRDRLVAVAAEMLATDDDVSLRKVASAAGTSTMAVYTHFDGMPGLWRAVREQAFATLAGHLNAVATTADPVADLVAVCRAYVANAVADRPLYLALFDARQPDPPPASAEMTFAVLVAAVERAVAGRRLAARTDAVDLATRVWAATHGVVDLVFTGALRADDLDRHLPPTYAALLVAAGDGPRKAETSTRRGWEQG